MQKEMHDVSINNPNRLTHATASQLEFKDYYLFLLFCSYLGNQTAVGGPLHIT